MVIAAHQLEREGFTVEDIFDFPDDGRRYELLDGMLIVNPAPIVPHQIALLAVVDLLRADAPDGWRVLPAPVGWRPAKARWFEPDVVVFELPQGRRGPAFLEAPPALVVEILSPSTRSYDQLLKRQAYDEGGVGAYWIVDPSFDNPSVVVLERPADGGPLTEVSTAAGRHVARATHPWPVRIVPADLIR